MKTLLFILTATFCLTLQSLKAQENTPIMKTQNEESKFSCKLSSADLQKRKTTIITQLKGLMVDRTETETGFKYTFDGSDKTLDLLTNFIKTERSCCDFFVFTLTVAGDSKFVWLELSASANVKELIKNELDF